jgi:thiopurine S-methyltransferase
MDPSFWHARWSEGQIGFHQDQVHPDLIDREASWLAAGPHRVLVPLCGKSHDLAWLASRGHEVVGVELVETAVRAVFDALQVEPEIERVGPHTAYRTERLTVLHGDVFDVHPDRVGTFSRVWDRAALVALDAPRRRRYAATLKRLAPAGSMLLSSMVRDPIDAPGPPHTVAEDEVRALYPSAQALLHRDEARPPCRTTLYRVDL